MAHSGYHFSTIVVAGLLLTACLEKRFQPETWAIDPVLNLSASGYVFTSYADSMVLKVNTNYNNFDVNSQAEWCRPVIRKSDSTIVVHVLQNKAIVQRQTTVTVSVHKGEKSLSRDLNVVQLGGKWDMAGDFSLFWGYDINDSQKDIIANYINNLVSVEGGTFEMGSDIVYNALPPHMVTVSDFYIAKYELTQREWNAVMGHNNSRFVGEGKPVEIKSWDEATEFVIRLSNLTGLDFKLPTEAQWEYAAKGGKFSMGYIYPGSDNLEEVAHITTAQDESSSLFTTATVGSKIPNELGLFDMVGNVEELCSDYYRDNYVSNSTLDPIGPVTGDGHVSKGGDFHMYSISCEPSSRHSAIFSTRCYYGLRLILQQ